MVIKKLRLTNFRNYAFEEVEFSATSNFVVGKNAQGKTNLIEPIYILSTLKSFRNSKLVDCIKDGENEATIEAEVNSKIYGDRRIKLVIKKEGENEFYCNENKIALKKEMFGFVYSVVFSPDELRLVKSGPEVRREFLDTDISQVSKTYCNLLERYEEILASRNKLLKGSFYNKGSIDFELDIWDEQLAIVGSQIAMSRKNFISKINEKVSEIMEFLSKGKERLKLKYVGIHGNSREEKTEYFKNQLALNRERDKELGYTSVGPHRDEIKFFINDFEVKPYASQGQQRSVVLALKLAELQTIEEEKESPVLLLDDVFSELDNSRQLAMLEYLKDKQIFVTSTFSKTAGVNEFQRLRIVDGKVKSKEVKN